jgi:hypothetical protein
VLLAMAKVGLIWDLRTPPKWVLDEGLGKASPKQSVAERLPSIAPDVA